MWGYDDDINGVRNVIIFSDGYSELTDELQSDFLFNILPFRGKLHLLFCFFFNSKTGRRFFKKSDLV